MPSINISHSPLFIALALAAHLFRFLKQSNARNFNLHSPAAMLQFIFLVLFGNLHTREYLHIIIQFASIQIQLRADQAGPIDASGSSWQALLFHFYVSSQIWLTICCVAAARPSPSPSSSLVARVSFVAAPESRQRSGATCMSATE